MKVNNILSGSVYRLAATYLAIIMLMSIGFSVVFYNTSWHELGRQLPPSGRLQLNDGVFYGETPRGLDKFLRYRIDEGRKTLLHRLILLNVLALVGGGALSFWLAELSLRPIRKTMEAQSQFVSDASHELRTPLTAIQTANDVALRNPKLTLAEAKKVLSDNIEETEKLRALSSALSDLAKQDASALKLTPTSLQDVASRAMNQVVRPAQAKKISVEDSVTDAKVLAHPERLAQILVILLDNAIKYSPAKSTIYLSSEIGPKYAALNVRDEGIGIRASDLPHIFRRFYRADTARTSGENSGYGLGLAIAQKLAQQQNAHISVQSEPGKGSTFTIRLRRSV